MEENTGQPRPSTAELVTRSGLVETSRATSVFLALGLAAGYYFLGRFAFLMVPSEGSSTSVAFLPEGLALALSILFGPRICVGILLGQFALSVSLGNSPAVGASFGIINMLEGAVGGWLFWRWKISPRFSSPRDILRLLALSGLLLQPLGALCRISAQMALANTESLLHLSFYAWAGNVMGQILVVPAILTWCHPDSKLHLRGSRETSGILLIYLTGIGIFHHLDLGSVDQIYWISIFGWFFLILIWNSMRSDPGNTSALNLAATMVFLWIIVESPDFSTQARVLYADMLIFGGVSTSLIITALINQLKELSCELARTNTRREQILAIVGHDLRSPLVDIRTALDVLRGGQWERAQLPSLHNRLWLVAEQTRWTLENVLEWAVLQFRDQKTSPGLWSVRDITLDLIELFRLGVEMKGLRVNIDIPEEALVRIDRQHLQSIVRNLLSNAVKFNKEGGEVHLTASRGATHWTFSCSDTGSGIHPEQLAVLRQWKGDLPASRTPGPRPDGIGLLIVGNLIEANGGTLTIDSTAGRGTTVHFTLPVARWEPSEAREPETARCRGGMKAGPQ